MSGKTEKERCHLAHTVGRFLNLEDERDHRRQAIEDLARLLAGDVCEAVRQALSEELRVCPFLPEDIAEKIARDVDAVAVPFVESSPVLSEEFLADLVEDCSEHVRGAVAARPGLGEAVAIRIVERGAEYSVGRLLVNDRAEVSSEIGFRVCERFGENDGLLISLSRRPDLRLVVIDRLVEKLSQDVSDKLVADYGLAEDYAGYLRAQTHRRALQHTFGGASDSEIEAYLKRLHRLGDLGPDMLLHFVETGELRFFRIALAVRAGIPEPNVARLLDEGGALGFDRLLEKGGIGEVVTKLIRTSYYSNFGWAARAVRNRGRLH